MAELVRRPSLRGFKRLVLIEARLMAYREFYRHYGHELDRHEFSGQMFRDYSDIIHECEAKLCPERREIEANPSP